MKKIELVPYSCRAPEGLRPVAQKLATELSESLQSTIGGRIYPGQALYLAALYLRRAWKAGEIDLAELLEMKP